MEAEAEAPLQLSSTHEHCHMFRTLPDPFSNTE